MQCYKSPDAAWRRLPATLAFGLLWLLITAGAAAAQGEPAEVGPAVSLRVTPATLEISEGGAGHLRIENTGTRPVHVSIDLAEFTVTEDGTTRFAGPHEASASNWVRLTEGSFELDAGERHELAIAVDVPDDAEPGERYVSVLLSVPPPDTADGNVAVTHRIAARLYIQVPSERIERVEVGELTGPRLVDGPAELELTVHNRGNVHRQFARNTQLIATANGAEIPFPAFSVLGDSTRIVQTAWNDPPTFCWCNITVEIDDGQGNIASVSTVVIVFPWRLTIILLALVAGLAMFRRGRQRARLARVSPSGPSTLDDGPAPAPTTRRSQDADGASQPEPGPEHPHPRLFTAKGAARRR